MSSTWGHRAITWTNTDLSPVFKEALNKMHSQGKYVYMYFWYQTMISNVIHSFQCQSIKYSIRREASHSILSQLIIMFAPAELLHLWNFVRFQEYDQF